MISGISIVLKIAMVWLKLSENIAVWDERACSARLDVWNGSNHYCFHLFAITTIFKTALIFSSSLPYEAPAWPEFPHYRL